MDDNSVIIYEVRRRRDDHIYDVMRITAKEDLNDLTLTEIYGDNYSPTEEYKIEPFELLEIVRSDLQEQALYHNVSINVPLAKSLENSYRNYVENNNKIYRATYDYGNEYSDQSWYDSRNVYKNKDGNLTEYFFDGYVNEITQNEITFNELVEMIENDKIRSNCTVYTTPVDTPWFKEQTEKNNDMINEDYEEER